MLEEEENKRRRTEMILTMEQLKEMPKFSGLGFFDADRGCLVGMLATSMTYVVILLQYDTT